MQILLMQVLLIYFNIMHRIDSLRLSVVTNFEKIISIHAQSNIRQSCHCWQVKKVVEVGRGFSCFT